MTLTASLAFGLALSSQKDESNLCHWWLSTLMGHFQPKGIMLGMLDVSGRQLVCQGWIQGREITLSLAVDDYSHPLACVLQKLQPWSWDSLLGGARIAHPGFRALLAELGQACGLHARPLLATDGRPVAVLALLDKAQRLQTWQASEELTSLIQIFCNQLGLMRELGQSRRERSVLQDSLRQRQDKEALTCQHQRLLVEQLVGESAAIVQLRQQIHEAASHRLSVLTLGETGCGKEVVARLIHLCSPRADKPFVAINCAAIPENLIESELFGYQKGAFSGASSNKSGLVAQAHGGTLFLDEVGDMPLTMQAKLLRVLETRYFRPLGGDKECYSDFRLVAATHQPLSQWVAEGRFRADLYHRLCQSLLRIPPLRERMEDIHPLCHHFWTQFASQEGEKRLPLPPSLLQALQHHNFPGNVRELRNLLEVLWAHGRNGRPISLACLPVEFAVPSEGSRHSGEDEFIHIRDLRQAIRHFEASVIASRMHQFQGNRLLVAQSLNLPKRTLDHKCQKLEVN
ncbi:MAG: sigma-54 interaction domain-containing protein [Aeromonadaceae bacterium]